MRPISMTSGALTDLVGNLRLFIVERMGPKVLRHPERFVRGVVELPLMV